MPRKKKVEKPAPVKAWWLGPVIVFVIMLSITLLIGLLTPALGSEAVLALKEDNLEPDEDFQFEVVTAVGTLDVKNDTVTVSFRFSNQTENTLTENLVLYYSWGESSYPVTLNGGETREDNIQIPVNESGIYDFAMRDPENDNRYIGGFTFKWGPPRISDVISQVFTYSLTLAVVYLHATRFEKVKFWPSVGVRKKNWSKSIIWAFALSVVFTLVLYFYWVGVQSALGSDPQGSLGKFFAGSPDWYFVYLGIAFFFPVAFTEELVFRGFMIERFRSKGAMMAVSLSALLFASLHIWYLSFGLGAGLAFLGGIFLIGIWWGIAYFKTGNILGLILAHGIFNSATTVNYFWGIGGVALLQSLVFVAGVACILYLVFLYLRRLFMEMEELVKVKSK